MDLIFRVKQIRELEELTRKERRKLINKNQLIYNHWQGWLGYILFVFGLVFIMSTNYWLPKEVSLLYRLLIIIPVGLIIGIIHRVCYLSTIAPYIRKDIELMRHDDV